MAKGGSKTEPRAGDDQWSEADWAALEAVDPGMAKAIRAGARFVVFPYCVSLILVSFKRSSGVIYLAPGEKTRAWEWILLSAVAGWWGIPWGPFWTIRSINQCLHDGITVTGAMIRARTRPVRPMARRGGHRL